MLYTRTLKKTVYGAFSNSTYIADKNHFYGEGSGGFKKKKNFFVVTILCGYCNTQCCVMAAMDNPENWEQCV